MTHFLSRLTSIERRFVVGVVLVIFVVLNVAFVWPHFSDWNTVKNRLDTTRNKLAAYQIEIAQIPNYKAELSELENEGSEVPAEDQSIDFLRTIQMQAADSGVNIIDNSRPTTTTNQFFVELTQGINVQCGEKQLVDFLYNLGSGNSMIRVRDLALHPDASRQQLNANIKLVASYQKKPAARPATTAVATTATQPPTTTKR